MNAVPAVLRLHFGMPCWVLDTPAATVKGRRLVYLFGLSKSPDRWAAFRRQWSGRPLDVVGCRIRFDVRLMWTCRCCAKRWRG